MKKGDKISVRIEKLAYGGKGIARVDNQIVFVDEVLPGDLAEIRIQKKKKKFLQGRVTRLLEKSPLRINASCSHFGHCGGCKWQNLEYEEQLKFKREQVIESLEHLADIHPEQVYDTLPSPLKFHYRNKMEFSFTDRRWLLAEELSDPSLKKDFALGLHVPGAFDRIMHIDFCWLQDDMMNNILTSSQVYFRESGIPVFNLKSHQGLIRFLVLRKSFKYEEYMINIVTFREAENELRDYSQKMQDAFPKLVSIVNTVNPRVAQIAFGEEEYLLFGKPTIREKIGRYEFDISANSFFQTNPLQAENLYRRVVNQVGCENKLIWDFYAGTGTIAMFLSEGNRKIIGFELIESAVKDAYRNCEQNGIENCEFVQGDLRKNLEQFSEKPDVIVCDPPRSGMHGDVVQAIREVEPRKIVYVSCNPATMARDVKVLSEKYRVTEVHPIDMFPHTYHIESVITLELR
ncbi:MAG: 23S rRNA (uracil(1939)-C(5))-methyltransferase RlmD [bacterium]|nr:MAG: 23S rRNA (uracil(1939)-C(5))-methyltransferase RlmD [bacterium]